MSSAVVLLAGDVGIYVHPRSVRASRYSALALVFSKSRVSLLSNGGRSRRRLW